MKIHILGIAGTFMSAIAILAKKKGHEVTGSDTSCYDPMKSILEKKNIKVINGHKIKDIKNKVKKKSKATNKLFKSETKKSLDGRYIGCSL